jgi:hypothetical protein
VGFADDGFAIVPGVAASEEIDRLLGAIATVSADPGVRSRGGVYAIRNLLRVVPCRKLVEPLLGAGAMPVRGILFDKTPEANWKVPWHQDLSSAFTSG